MSWNDPSTWIDKDITEVVGIWSFLSFWRRIHNRILELNLCLDANRGFWFELADAD